MKIFLIPFVLQMYYKEEIAVLDADYADVIEQYHSGGDSVYCLVREDAAERPSWQAVSSEQWGIVRAQMHPAGQ